MLSIQIKRLIFLFALLCCSSAAHATTYYIAAIGSDSNTAHSKASPWLHAPGMPNCSGSGAGTCGGTTPAAGDSFIFKGGDTWHWANSSASPYVGGTWNWNYSGSGTNCNLNTRAGAVITTSCIYIGVDQTWFTGGSWVRPILTMDNALSTSAPASCTYSEGMSGSTTNGFYLNGSYLILDSFDLQGNCSNAGGSVWIVTFGDQIEFTNWYMHGWTLATGPNTPVIDDFQEVGFGSGSGFILYDHLILDGSDSSFGTTMSGQTTGENSGNGLGVCSEIRFSVFRRVSNGCVGGSAGGSYTSIISVHDSLFDNMYNSNTAVPPGSFHGNVIETGNASADVWFYNNTASNINEGEIFNFGSVNGGNYYIANNTIFEVQAGNCFLLIWGTAARNTAYITNNTWVTNSSDGTGCKVGGGSMTTSNMTLNYQNNHFIGYSPQNTSAVQGSGSPTINDNGGELWQTNAQATTAGYTTSNNFQPTSGSSPTVHAGNNLSSTCSTLLNCSGTSGGETSSGGTFTGLFISPQPSRGSTFDVGAYQFSAGTPTCAAPTASPTSGIPPQTVTLSSSTMGCNIFYSTSGTATCSSTTYSGPISVTINPTTISAVTCQTSFTTGGPSSWTYSGSVSTTPAPTTSPFVQLVTPGTWKGRYGNDGYLMALGDQKLPSYVSGVSFTGNADWNWQAPLTDGRGLILPSTGVPWAACFYSANPWSLAFNMSDGKPHMVTFYLVDWDNQSRCETVTWTSSAGAQIDSRELCNFSPGAYLTWQLQGSVKASFTRNAGPNSVLSSIMWN